MSRGYIPKALRERVAYHVGQIVFLAKHLAGSGWRTLSVPRGGTRAFNEKMFGKG